MNDINKKKFEISQQIRYLEKERDRSWKWFFVNLLATFTLIGLTLLSLWFIPKLIDWIARKMNWLSASGVLATNISWADQVRLDYIKWISFFFLIANLTFWLSWTAFRFRKWSKYQRRIEVLEQELKELEKVK